MRDSYTPLFSDLLTSSLWATTTPATRCVWITLLCLADPDGYVGAAVPGIARAACVSVDEAREAIALLEAPDPDSRTPDHDGRRIARVERGWQILNFVAMRERAKREARRAYQAGWVKGRRAANDNAEPEPPNVDSDRQSIDTQKQKQKHLPSEGERSPLPPESTFRAPDAPDAPVLPAVVHELPEDLPVDELRAEAVAAGVPAADFDRRLAELRAGPIGGQRGVLAHKVPDYVRSMFGRWRTWAETDRAKAQRAAQAPPGRAFGGGARVGPMLEPNARHAAYAEQHGVDLDALVRRLNDEMIVDKLGVVGARQHLERALTVAARERAIERARAAG